MLESKERFNTDELYRYLYFTYINTNGISEDYEIWKNKRKIYTT
ncbi:MAG: hypothetical protein ACM3O3_12540 [Syntrophothermus sp.]